MQVSPACERAENPVESHGRSHPVWSSQVCRYRAGGWRQQETVDYCDGEHAGRRRHQNVCSHRTHGGSGPPPPMIDGLHWVFKREEKCLFSAVSANEGDAYPLGALPVGTLVNNLEIQPGKGSEYIRAAGNLFNNGAWVTERPVSCSVLPTLINLSSVRRH